jgi:hypothetical protein
MALEPLIGPLIRPTTTLTPTYRADHSTGKPPVEPPTRGTTGPPPRQYPGTPSGQEPRYGEGIAPGFARTGPKGDDQLLTSTSLGQRTVARRRE